MIEYIKSLEELFLSDLKAFIAIPTIRSSKEINAPFGLGIKAGFQFIIDIAKREGLSYKYLEGYALHVEYGQGQIFGFLNHIDTVGIDQPEEWLTDPFEMVIKDDYLYGRGVNDNKGPLLGILYMLIALKRLNIQVNQKIRLIIGGAEETTWEGIRYYFEREAMPKLAISPDGNFPIVNCEKGVRYYHLTGYEENDLIKHIKSIGDYTKVCNHVEVTDSMGTHIFKGQSAPSRHPSQGESSILKMFDVYLNSLKIFDLADAFYKDMNERKDFTCNISECHYDGHKYDLHFDLRWASDIVEEEVDCLVKAAFQSDVQILEMSKRRLYIAPDDPFIGSLKEAYYEVTGKTAELLTKGGASYARVLDKGIAFGPCFPGELSNQHQPNEKQSLSGLYKALEIYYNMLIKCGVLNEIENHGDHSTVT